MPPVALIAPTEIDTTQVVADLDAIRAANPQRFEMEQLSAIVHLDTEQNLIVGYKDVSPNEFWAQGHIPGYPLMPGVLICEAAAQLCSYYCRYVNLVPGGFLGFGGMEDIRFRGQVKPGQRLLIAGKAHRLHRRQTIFDTQAFVDEYMVFHGRIIGVPLKFPSEDETDNEGTP